jgi:hypothetical protein
MLLKLGYFQPALSPLTPKPGKCYLAFSIGSHHIFPTFKAQHSFEVMSSFC